MNNKKLHMSLSQIRNNINLEKLDWENIYTTNCYAFALGLDISEKDIIEHAFQPGIISNSKWPTCKDTYFSKDTLIKDIYNDLDMLHIKHEETDPFSYTSDNEWKIALFISKPIFDNMYRDFHFLRLFNNGYWYHKNGYRGSVSNKDYQNDLIIDPSLCDLYKYDYVSTLSLKLKK